MKLELNDVNVNNTDIGKFYNKKYVCSIVVVYASLAILFAMMYNMTICSASEAILNANNNITMGGTPVFPLGLYSVPDNDIAGLPQSFNFIANPYWAQSQSDTPAFLGSCIAAGRFGIIGFDNDQLSPLNKTYVTDYINSVKTNAAVAAYYFPDEPYSTGFSTTALSQAYTLIKQLDPTTPVIITDYDQNAPGALKNDYDIFVYDWYPFGQASIELYRSRIESIIKSASPKPTWAVLQGYTDGTQYLEPTQAELRAMAYVAVINGARGLLAYKYGDASDGYMITQYPGLWTSLQNVMNGLSALSAILLAPNASAVSATTDTQGLDMMVKQSGGDYYLFVCNWKCNSLYTTGHDPGVDLGTVQINLQGVGDSRISIIAGDNAGAVISSVNSQGFTDNFPPYCVKVYQIQPQANLPAPSGVRLISAVLGGF